MPLRILDRSWIKVQFQFEPRDLWVGVFWRIKKRKGVGEFLHLYICILPLIPLHITVLWKIENTPEEKDGKF
jgi:hypothetical protein